MNLSSQLKRAPTSKTGVLTNRITEMVAARLTKAQIEEAGGLKLIEQNGELFLQLPLLPIKPRQVTKADGSIAKLVSLVDGTDYDQQQKKQRSIFVDLKDSNGSIIPALFEIKLLYPGYLDGHEPKESPRPGALLEGPSDKVNTPPNPQDAMTPEEKRVLGIQD